MPWQMAGDAMLDMANFVRRARGYPANRTRRATDSVLQPAAQGASVTESGMPKMHGFAFCLVRQHFRFLEGCGGQFLRLFDDHLDDLDDGAQNLAQEDRHRNRVAECQRQRRRCQMGRAADLLGQQESDKLGRDRRNQRHEKPCDKYRE
jgi:hypothetical protein